MKSLPLPAKMKSSPSWPLILSAPPVPYSVSERLVPWILAIGRSYPLDASHIENRGEHLLLSREEICDLDHLQLRVPAQTKMGGNHAAAHRPTSRCTAG
jgi:hypothetical protein